MTVELMSLCLTGRMCSSYEDWESNGGLGIGVLSMLRSGNKDDPFIKPRVSRGLTRPSKHVWIVQGERGYSTMWLEDPDREANYLNSYGSAFTLTHQSCWGRGKKTTVKVVTARRGEEDTTVNQTQNLLTDKDLQRITHNPEDETHYPQQYKRWMFTIRAADDDKDAEKAIVSMPYFRLKGQAKQMVDYKYAPRIHMVVWSRWKGAAVTLSSSSAPVI